VLQVGEDRVKPSFGGGTGHRNPTFVLFIRLPSCVTPKKGGYLKIFGGNDIVES